VEEKALEDEFKGNSHFRPQTPDRVKQEKSLINKLKRELKVAWKLATENEE